MSADTIQTRPVEPNELHPELLSTNGLNPFPGNDSSSRVQMFASSHLSQALQIAGCNSRRTFTGVESEFAKTTFKIKMPVNGTILKIIEKYPRTVGMNAIRQNPLKIVVYEDVETRVVGILSIPDHHCQHQHFGFKYKPNITNMQKIFVGANIAKGTIFADSPAVSEDGDYCYGVDTQVAFMSLPGVIEDGVIASKSYLKKLITKGFESRVASWGKEWYPLNLYGTDTEYKAFPDIGQPIRDDGLLFALRRYDDFLAPVEMTPAALREPDYTFDRTIYGIPGATITDVTVRHDTRTQPPPTPVGMELQAERYASALTAFYSELLKIYNDLRRQRKEGLKVTPEFHRLLVEALMDNPDSSRDKSIRMYQRVPLDDWRVELTFQYDVIPTTAFKITDNHGGKGVICEVWDDEDMPIDAEGNRAELIMDGESTIRRTNLGRLYEQYFNATSRTVTNYVRRMMANDPKSVAHCFEYLKGYYKICTPPMYDLLTSPSYQGTPAYHVESVIKEGVYLNLPTDNPAEYPVAIRQLRKEYPTLIGPVTYRGRSGNLVTTRDPVLIGSLYIMLLEKTGVDWSAVDSAKLNCFGIPARLTNRDKHSAPGRQMPVRLTGEDEVRLFAATIGGDATAEMMEMSNNPTTHKHIVTNILHAKQPTNIENVVNRSVVPRGNSRPLIFIRHMLQSCGIILKYNPIENQPDSIYVGPNTKADGPLMGVIPREDD